MSHTVNPTLWRRFSHSQGSFMMKKDKLSASAQNTKEERKTGKIHEHRPHSDTTNLLTTNSYSISYSPAHEGHILTKDNEVVFSSRDRVEVVEEYQKRAQNEINLIHHQKRSSPNL